MSQRGRWPTTKYIKAQNKVENKPKTHPNQLNSMHHHHGPSLGDQRSSHDKTRIKVGQPVLGGLS
jgi:hypothetical protein